MNSIEDMDMSNESKKNQFGHDQASELLPLLAIHSLEENEKTGVEAHLESCETCQKELDNLYEIVAMLGGSESGIDNTKTSHIWEKIESNLLVPDGMNQTSPRISDMLVEDKSPTKAESNIIDFPVEQSRTIKLKQPSVRKLIDIAAA